MADNIHTVSDSDNRACSGFSPEASERPPEDGQVSSTKSSSKRRSRRRSARPKENSPDARPRKRSRTGSSAQKSTPDQQLPPETSSDTETDLRPSRSEETESTYFVPRTPGSKRTRPKFHNTSTSHDSTTSTSGGSDLSVPMLFSGSGSEQQTPLTPPSVDSGAWEAFESGDPFANVSSSSPSPCPPPSRKNRRRISAQTKDLARDDQTDDHFKVVQHDASTQTDDLAVDGHASAAPEAEPCDCYYEQYKKKIDEAELDHDLRQLLLNGPRKKPANTTAEAVSQSSSAEPTRGYNYIHFWRSHDGFVKMGWAECIPIRRKRLQRASPRAKRSDSEGKLAVLPGHTLETVPSNTAIQYYTFAETLLKKELHNERRCLYYRTSSNNPDGYTEWFEVSTEVATQRRDKWVKWLDNCEPYDEEGKIKPFWRDRIERRGNYEEQTPPKSLHSFWLKVLNVPLQEQVYTWCCTFAIRLRSKSHTICALLLKDVLQLMFHANIFSLSYAFYFFFSFLIYGSWIVDFGSIAIKESIKQVLIVVLYTLFLFFVRANWEWRPAFVDKLLP